MSIHEQTQQQTQQQQGQQGQQKVNSRGGKQRQQEQEQREEAAVPSLGDQLWGDEGLDSPPSTPAPKPPTAPAPTAPAPTTAAMSPGKAELPMNVPSGLPPSLPSGLPSGPPEAAEPGHRHARAPSHGLGETFPLLLAALEESADDLAVIERYAEDPEFGPALGALSPVQFGRLVGKVKSGFDQPRAAELLARALKDRLTAEHVAAALADSGMCREHRVALVRALSGECADVLINAKAILGALSGWEQAQCRRILTGLFVSMRS